MAGTAQEIEVDGRGRRVAVFVSRFNQHITERLLEGCEARLKEAGCDQFEVAWVPGAFELPLVCKIAGESGRYDAIVALGCVIRGDTSHFDFVCRAVTDGLRQAILETRRPIAFEVLMTDTEQQALVRAARAGEPGENLGRTAGETALEMAALLETIGRPS